MKRKTYALLSIIVLASLLVACGSDKKKNTAKEPTPAPSVDLIEITPEPTVEPTPEPLPDYSMFEPVTPEVPVETYEQPTEYSPYTFTNLDVYMYANDNVNVRSIPSTEGEKLGKLTVGATADVTGQCVENSWYRINYNGTVGYVKNDYLQTSQPVVATPKPTPAPTPAPVATAAPSASPAPEASAGTTASTSTEAALYPPAKGSDYKKFVRNDSSGSYYSDTYGYKLEYVNASGSVEVIFTIKGLKQSITLGLEEPEADHYEIFACKCCNDTYAVDGIHSIKECLEIDKVKGYQHSESDPCAKWMGNDGRVHELIKVYFMK